MVGRRAALGNRRRAVAQRQRVSRATAPKHGGAAARRRVSAPGRAEAGRGARSARNEPLRKVTPAARRAQAERDLEAALASWADAANRGAASVAQWYADPVPVLYGGKNVPRSAVAAARKKAAPAPSRIDARAGRPGDPLGEG